MAEECDASYPQGEGLSFLVVSRSQFTRTADSLQH